MEQNINIDLKSYQELLKKLVDDFTFKNEIIIKNNLQSECKFILDKNIELINFELDRVRKWEESIANWNDFNQQYKKYFIDRINKIIKISNEIIKININKNNSMNFYNFNNSLLGLIDNTGITDLFEYFKYGNSNYVIFGKNGSGKTTLISKIHKDMININSIVSPATRNIHYDSNVRHVQSDISLNNALSNNRDNVTMFYLSKCINIKEMEDRRNNKNEEQIISNKLINIFNSLGLERELIITSEGNLKLSNGVESYFATTASDGEKSALYFIMVALLANENSYFIIDEPENHLNGSLMKKLFDILENERKDLKFIYSTHNIDFIQTRTNVELVYLEKTLKHNFWNFKKLATTKDISLNMILTIEGTNDDVIFCEGENEDSYDNKLYNLIFPNYQIISSKGCENVIQKTEIFNQNSAILKKNAHGIIDFDFRGKDELKSLEEQHIAVLSVNEIENLYISEVCLDIMREFMQIEKTLDVIKEEIINYIEKKKDDIKKDYATKTFRNLHKNNKFDNIVNIDDTLLKINNENNIKFKNKYQLFDDSLEKWIKEKNYEELMKVVPGKIILNNVAKIFGFLNSKTYMKQILSLIKNDNSLIKKLKSYINLV